MQTLVAPAGAEHLSTADALAALAGDVAPAELEAHSAHAADCPRCAELFGVVVALGVQAVETATVRS
jgi:hypothetical protein